MYRVGWGGMVGAELSLLGFVLLSPAPLPPPPRPPRP